MKTLFYNGCSHAIVRADMNLNDALDTFYLIMVPWFQLHARHIESFRREGERTVIGVEDNAVIDIDWNAKAYTASLDGSPICSEAGTFCPLDTDRIAFYSLTAQELTANLPRGWQASEVRASKLSANGAEEFQISVDGSRVKARVEARIPVIAYRNDAVRRQRRPTVS